MTRKQRNDFDSFLILAQRRSENLEKFFKNFVPGIIRVRKTSENYAVPYPPKLAFQIQTYLKRAKKLCGDLVRNEVNFRYYLREYEALDDSMKHLRSILNEVSAYIADCRMQIKENKKIKQADIKRLKIILQNLKSLKQQCQSIILGVERLYLENIARRQDLLDLLIIYKTVVKEQLLSSDN